MNELKVFENEQFGKVRIIIINNEPWFVGKDVTEVLEYQNGSRDINRHVDEEDRIKQMIFDGTQNKETIVINESGLFSLILSSKMPKAKEFKHWVTSDVLPSIRKYGLYATDNLIDKVVENPDFLIDILVKYKEEKQKSKQLGQQVLERDKIIEEQKPKINYVDKVLSSDSLVTITQIAKDYGMSAKTFNKILADNKIQFKVNGQWCLYSEHQGKGYTHSKTYEFERSNGFVDTKMNTLWTQKGRLFLYETLKKVDILPTIDREQKQ